MTPPDPLDTRTEKEMHAQNDPESVKAWRAFDDIEKVTTPDPLEAAKKDLDTALRCLYIAVDEDIADDISAKVTAGIDAAVAEALEKVKQAWKDNTPMLVTLTDDDGAERTMTCSCCDAIIDALKPKATA